MPELPEVETIVRQLKPALLNKIIKALHIHWPKTVEMTPFQAENIRNRKILDIIRRGKWILFLLDDSSRLAIHLRMTGQLSLSSLVGRKQHLRVEIEFSDLQRLFFYDPRKFGRIRLVDSYEKSWLNEIGVEPLCDDSLISVLISLQSRRTVKAVLLDQTIVAGIGNIYADEALFLARVNPLRLFCSLTETERHHLAAAVREVLLLAIENGGSTISSYRSLHGESGFHQQHHLVYQRNGQKCIHCRSIILRTRTAGRSTHFCPTCQL